MILTIDSPTGGTGCTTIAVSIAAALANQNQNVTLISTTNDSAHMLGVHPNHDQARVANINVHRTSPQTIETDIADHAAIVDHVVIDRGTQPHPNLGTSLTVLSNCYLSLRKYSALPTREPVPAREPHHIIYRDLPGRALTKTDVSAVTAMTPIVTIPTDHQISRAIDAGLLITHTPSELSSRIEALIDILINQESTP